MTVGEPDRVVIVSALHFTTLRNHNVLRWLAFRVGHGPRVLNLGDNIHAFDDITKDYMLAVQMRSSAVGGNDEELAAVGILKLISRSLVNLRAATLPVQN